jgi:hypothetical protein
LLEGVAELTGAGFHADNSGSEHPFSSDGQGCRRRGATTMNADSVNAWLRKQPFAPFRVTTSAGERFEIRHPEMALLTRVELLIGLAERQGVPTRYRSVALLHVTAIEPIDSPAAA